MHSQLSLTATAWARLPDVDAVRPRGADDDAVLQEIREVLERHGATHRFGVALNHRHFELAPGEVVFETTDPSSRRQIIEPRWAAEVLGSPGTLETQWVFDGPSNALVCVGFCDYNKGHKRIHNQK